MKNGKNKKKKKISLNIESIYGNDYKLIKIIEKTKGMRKNNQSLTERKNNLKNLITQINDDDLNLHQHRKSLHLSNENFKNEYNLFKKGKNNKESKLIFKDLIKLYKSRGYRIPNFSINEHNIFKLSPLLESNATIISNGLLTNQILKKSDDSEKIINYLKKIGLILSEKITNDNIQKDFKKLKISKLKYFNEEDSVEELKKKIEILKNLINTNALSKLDEPKKVNYKSISRQSSFRSNKFVSNKNLYLKRKLSTSNNHSRKSNINPNINRLNYTNTKKVLKLERKNSIESSMTYTSLKSNKNNKQKDSEDNIYKMFNNVTGNIKSSKTPKEVKIPALNLNKIFIKMGEEQNKDNNNIILPNRNNNMKSKTRLNTQKINNLIKTPKMTKKYSNWIRKSNKDCIPHLINPFSGNNNQLLSNRINQSNDSFSIDEFNEPNFQTTTKKKNTIKLPYTNKNEFVNYAYSKLTKKGINNCENYLKNYLNNIEGYNDDMAENYIQNIYNKNIKNNLKELETQITDNDIYCKTERIYLGSHLIKRIKNTLKNMDEKDKIILKLEKNFAHTIISK